MAISLRRLQDVPVKGNFSINCETVEEVYKIMHLFHRYVPYVIFRGVQTGNEWADALVKKWTPIMGDNHDESKLGPPINTAILLENTERACRKEEMVDKDKPKFTIKYESLAELLKLRDIFKIRGCKFDTYLIEKRKMGTFDSFFSDTLLEEFGNLNISKVRK